MAALAASLAVLAAADSAFAADPGTWTNTGVSRIPLVYYQGVASDPDRNFYFDGIYTGLFRTDRSLRQTAAAPEPPGVIPPAVRAGEKYNHIGDIAWGPGEGGRILLPLECYYPGTPGGANTCQNGAIGVADPGSLAWRYYVKLAPAGIKKAMWVEGSPDGSRLWSSDGDDLVAYDSGDVNMANAANPLNPASPTISEVERLKGAVPPAGITGAVFYNGRLYTAGQGSGGLFQVYSTDLDTWDSGTETGDQRLEIELPAGTVGESEGLAVNSTCGGVLHWIVTPFNLEGKPPTYGASENALLNFVPTGSQPPGSACKATQPGSGPTRAEHRRQPAGRWRAAVARRRPGKAQAGSHPRDARGARRAALPDSRPSARLAAVRGPARALQPPRAATGPQPAVPDVARTPAAAAHLGQATAGARPIHGRGARRDAGGHPAACLPARRRDSPALIARLAED